MAQVYTRLSMIFLLLLSAMLHDAVSLTLEERVQLIEKENIALKSKLASFEISMGGLKTSNDELVNDNKELKIRINTLEKMVIHQQRRQNEMAKTEVGEKYHQSNSSVPLQHSLESFDRNFHNPKRMRFGRKVEKSTQGCLTLFVLCLFLKKHGALYLLCSVDFFSGQTR